MTTIDPVIGRWRREGSPGSGVSGYLQQTGADPRSGHGWRLLLDGDLGEIESGYETALTLFGTTAAGPMTLHHASPWHSRSSHGEGGSTMQEWRAFTLLSGGHYPRDHRFTGASFEAPHAIHWLGPSRLNRYARPDPLPTSSNNDEATKEAATLVNGMQLTAWLADSHTVAPLKHRVEHAWRAVYSISSADGFTFGEADEVAHAVARLQSLAFGIRMDSHAMSLSDRRISPYHRVLVIDPGPPAGADWTGLSPFVDTSEIDFEAFLNAWLKLRKEVPLVDSVVEWNPATTTVQDQIIVHCSVLESIAQQTWSAPGLTASDEQILEALRSGCISRRSVKMVAGQLQQRRWPLETKLMTAAAMLGTESSKRLLGDVSAWAHLVMRTRNSLVHGVTLPSGLGEDGEFLIEVQQSVACVLRLIVLRQLGYTNGLSDTDGELLWSGAEVVASHDNSDFFKELQRLSAGSPRWAQWRRRLEGAAGA